MAMLEVAHLKKVYTTRFGGNQVEALRDVSFTVEQGEYTAIMGESGSGKTTLLVGTPYAEMQRRLEPIAKQLGITQLLKKFPYEVSGGQKQRAAVARALITNPRLILADEPTGALDSRSSDELLALFSAIHQSGQTIVMVTHSTKAAASAGRVMFIKDGEVFHQLYRGNDTNEQFYQRISDTLTLLTTGGEAR